MRRTLVAILLGLLSTPINDLNAQVVPDSLVGARVRVHLSRQAPSVEGAVPRQALRGQLLSTGPDSLVVQVHPEAAPVAVSLNGIYEVEASRGISRSRTAVNHALLGAVTWTGIGAMSETEFGGGETESILIWTAGGLILGGVLGAVFPEERWRRIFRR